MTLTVCVGSSGSGKTTYLNDVHKSHKCTYIRQYHNMRPYITVTKIPNFDPTKLPFWDIYVKEGVAATIRTGGTMAGKFTAGLSGGQRKLLLFELIFQRTSAQSELLIVLDEPFSGVTDDFVPFIKDRLNDMRKKHNILLVTNDHVQALTSMADNTITVSAIDRANVRINNREKVNRNIAIAAMSIGDQYKYKASSADLKFFFDTEVWHNQDLFGLAVFSTIVYSLFLATFWNSNEQSGALVLIAGGMLAYFSVNPYLLSLVEWRISMTEEAEALVHASKNTNKSLKLLLTLSVIFVNSLIEFGVVNAVIDGFGSVKFWVAMLFDSASLLFLLISGGLYTHFSFQTTQIIGGMPYLLMIFLSTTFSPGAGVPVLKELRYLFARFYFWCMVPAVEDSMEGCPNDELNLLYLVLSSFFFVVIFWIPILILKLKKRRRMVKAVNERERMNDNEDFMSLQLELFGDKVLRRFQHLKSMSSFRINHDESAAGEHQDS